MSEGLTNGSYREFPQRLREASEADHVRNTKWGGHYIANHLRDAANEIERLRAIIRVNALRAGASHAQVDHILFDSYLSEREAASEPRCDQCGGLLTWVHDHRSDNTGLDDGPLLNPPRKKPAPKPADETAEIRARAWETRRQKYGQGGHR